MKNTQKFMEQRKFVMVLPLLALPFLTVLFWILGGGPGTSGASKAAIVPGLNLDLPPAHFGEEQLDKLSLYEAARKDSLRFQEARDNDPYYKMDFNPEVTDPKQFDLPGKGLPSHRVNGSFADPGKNDANEMMVNKKLDELYRELNRKPSTEALPGEKSRVKEVKAPGSPELEQLESMMNNMHARRGSDPEGERINTMLEKILDIQHPERISEKLKAQSKKLRGRVFPVSQVADDNGISIMTHAREDTVTNTESSASREEIVNMFFGLDTEGNQQRGEENSIQAVVHGTQELVVGSTVKLRIVNEVYINGQLIEQGQFIFGTASINGERLMISINSVRHDTSLLPVSLSAYDLDGLEGIYVPGAITRDAAKQSSDQAMQSVQFMTMDQSVGAQAANAGVQAAKGLFSKKVKLVRVTVKAGYQVLLRDVNAKQ